MKWQPTAGHRYLVILVIAGHLVLAVAYGALNPLGEAPDEADHWAYIVFLARERRLPEGPRVTQSKHPPLYHGAAAAFASLAEPDFSFLRANPDISLSLVPNWSPNFFVHTTLESWPWRNGALAHHLVRLWSALLTTATVAAAYALYRCAFPDRPGLALAGAGVVAFLPELAFIGGSANNDTLATFLSTLALWGAMAVYADHGRWRTGWWISLALGLGLLAKVSTFAIWGPVALAIVGGAVGSKTNGLSDLPVALFHNRRRWITGLVWAFLPAIVIASPWFIRNLTLYDDLLGLPLVRQTIDLRESAWSWQDTVWLAKGWFLSFWGKFGGAGHIPLPGPVYVVLGILSLASVAGLIRAWFAAPWRRYRGPILIGLTASAGIMAAMWRYSLFALGTDQGRLLFPALSAFCLLFVVGLRVWVPDRWAALGGTTLVAGMAGLSLYGLFGVIRPAFAPPPLPATAEVARVATDQLLEFGELDLVGWQLEEVGPVLYWRSRTTPSQDYRTIVRIVAQDGSLVWEWRRSPGYGRWSTDHWPTGTIMRDAYRIEWPAWAGPGTYGVEVGLQPFAGEPLTPVRRASLGTAEDDIPRLSPEHPFAFLGHFQRVQE